MYPERQSIILQPHPSRRLLLGGAVGHGLAAVAVIVSSTPWWVQAGCIAGIALSLVWFGYRHGYPHGCGFIARAERLDERWRLTTGDGAAYWAWLIDGQAHPLVVILNFRLEDGKHRVLTLLPDSADVGVLRRVRVWLRTHRPDDAEPEPP
ncbi:MAG: hypothetical protein H6974_12655 [Gammaproteobacteria bacterium]|nr:hypothetical protein [Gammaproteobacteria bacterium]